MTLKAEMSPEIEAAAWGPKANLALRQVVVQELAEGAERDDVLAVLDSIRREARDSGRDDAENAAIEVMERMVGWCAPEARI
jgi:hypothetical protein